jgi:hypothetical protein
MVSRRDLLWPDRLQTFGHAAMVERAPIAVSRHGQPLRRNRQRSQPHNTIAGETTHCNQKEAVSVPNTVAPQPRFHPTSKA